MNRDTKQFYGFFKGIIISLSFILFFRSLSFKIGFLFTHSLWLQYLNSVCIDLFLKSIDFECICMTMHIIFSFQKILL